VYLFIGLHAFLQVKNQKQAIERFWYTRWYGLAGIYFSWILISAILQPTRTYLQFFHMPASSMAPTLIQGDFLIVQNAAFGVNFPGTHRKILNLRPPNRGDIVVFEYPEDQSKYFIKRVIGLSGETIEIKDKVVYVNGAQLTEPYAIHKDSTVLRAEIGPRDNFGPQSIPENTFFILGDNRDKSLDSRFFGPVGIDGIIGKATLIYFSSDMRSLEIRWDRIGTRFD